MIREKVNRGGMALAIILIAMFVFSIVMFAIANQQQHETRFTAISLEQEKAFVLADAGLARAMARHVARSYDKRWYGATPQDDAITDNEHAGRFDETSQSKDESGTGGPPAADKKLDPNGTYSVLVEDRFVGETSEPTSSVPSSKLAFTDVFSKGTLAGPHGDVSAVLFARIAIAPEPDFFAPTAGTTPSILTGESTPELVKKIIRYKVYFDPEVADKPYLQSGTDTAPLRQAVHEEVANFHKNFLINRDTFKDLRDPAKVNKDWHADTASKAQWTKADIVALFGGIAGPATIPSGSNAPPPPATQAGTFFNLWIDYMLRSYRVSDLVPANTGVHYVIGNNPTTSHSKVVKSILKAFHSRDLHEIPPEFQPGANPGVQTGEQLLQRLEASSAAEPGLRSTDPTLPRTQYDTNVSCFRRIEANAVILKGHWNPASQPPLPGTTGGPSTPTPIATSFRDQAFLDIFNAGTADPGTVDQMKAEIARVNKLQPNPNLSESTYINPGSTGEQPFPLYLRYDAPPMTTTTTTVQLSVPELITLYDKYVETQAVFGPGNNASPVPAPPVPTTPPPNKPQNPGPSHGGGGGGSSGGRPGGTAIGGSASGL